MTFLEKIQMFCLHHGWVEYETHDTGGMIMFKKPYGGYSITFSAWAKGTILIQTGKRSRVFKKASLRMKDADIESLSADPLNYTPKNYKH